MALIVKVKNPEALLTGIKKAIDSKSIQTWSYDSDGDFTHSPEQWQYKGWLRAKVFSGELHFGFLGHADIVTTKLIYAVYHGRFSEMLLNHFDNEIVKVEVTAMPTSIDKITQAKE